MKSIVFDEIVTCTWSYKDWSQLQVDVIVVRKKFQFKCSRASPQEAIHSMQDLLFFCLHYLQWLEDWKLKETLNKLIDGEEGL